MSVLFAFAFAVLFSFVGVLPPGIVNMTVANYSVKKTLKRAKKFINGAILVVFIQSVIGYYFATFLESHPQVMQNLKLVGSVVFVLLTIFFLGKGIQNLLNSKDEIKKKTAKSKLKPFLHGIFISGLNVFPIPYYAFVSLYLSAFIEDFFSNLVGIAFVAGTTLGTFIVFLGYAYLFRKIKHKVTFFIKNINFIIALITGLIAVFTIYKLNH
ncbi:LysE family transporter [Flavobacterium urocaniciphilum]|uniref:Threonine/homoserine/homoserine lactone efflux protein n=1 Tax=Flavobacterium urocaniciphilum TaxID=1299341 RepID=A0A1H9DSW6_9FLAO|nr:LysE family transporter [Flavobacterium urocaniciphilum]SEQ16596.1 Threonine/homoserine/homoserine lactone efflux protein [Flavobacterium urocaniciphilum]